MAEIAKTVIFIIIIVVTLAPMTTTANSCHSNVTCPPLAGCVDHHGNVTRALGDVWLLSDNQTVCNCDKYGNGTCTSYSRRVCLDSSKTTRLLGSKWFISNCTNCSCTDDGNIVCNQHHIEAYYGRFVVKKHMCYQDRIPVCVTSNETERDCQGKTMILILL